MLHKLVTEYPDIVRNTYKKTDSHPKWTNGGWSRIRLFPRRYGGWIYTGAYTRN